MVYLTSSLVCKDIVLKKIKSSKEIQEEIVDVFQHVFCSEICPPETSRELLNQCRAGGEHFHPYFSTQTGKASQGLGFGCSV